MNNKLKRILLVTGRAGILSLATWYYCQTSTAPAQNAPAPPVPAIRAPQNDLGMRGDLLKLHPRTLSLNPGAYAAILKAGGLAQFGNSVKFYVLRRTPNGNLVKIPVNMKAIESGDAPDFPLELEDVIVVQRSSPIPGEPHFYKGLLMSDVQAGITL